MSYVPGLVVQKYTENDWYFVAVTNAKNARRDLGIFKNSDPVNKYRIYNEVAKRVVYQ